MKFYMLHNNLIFNTILDEQWTSETGVCVDSTGNDPQRYIEDPIDFPCSEFERTVPELGCKEFCQSDSKCKGSTFYEQHLGGYGWGCKGKCVLFSGDIDGGDGTMNSQELMMSGFKCQFRSGVYLISRSHNFHFNFKYLHINLEIIVFLFSATIQMLWMVNKRHTKNTPRRIDHRNSKDNL